MQKFQSLEALSHLDYAQMRALDGHRATDNALLSFHTLVAKFFAQFPENQQPDIQTLELYVSHMHQIVAAINQQEYQFFLLKYQNDEEYADLDQETIQNMTLIVSRLNSINKIPYLMQFWAAAESFGDSIRFPVQHLASIKALNNWNRYAEEHGLNLNTPQP